MPTSATFNGTSYNIPNAGELNWAALTSFLVDVANNAQTTNFQKIAVRTALTSPVTVAAATDCIVISDLTVAGAVTVNLPAGASKQVFFILDGKGDAATNNITIDGNGAETINGAATYVISTNKAGVGIIFDGTGWKVFCEFLAEGVTRTGTQVITNKDYDGGTASNTSRITLPKAATATLNALTRKEATIWYDSTTDQVKYDDGTSLFALSSQGAQSDLISIDATSASVTIPSGQTAVHPKLIISTGHTYTVTGSLFAPGGISGPGTLAGAGTVFS